MSYSGLRGTVGIALSLALHLDVGELLLLKLGLSILSLIHQ